MGNDIAVMPHIGLANIACGFHAGDPSVIQNTIAMAISHNVKIGAHPSYPDLVGFGRRSMRLSSPDLINAIHYQISALDGMAKVQGTHLNHIKPHGALYNDMMSDQLIMEDILKSVASLHRDLPLVIQATRDWQTHLELAAKFDVKLIFEAFIDRAYKANGRLVGRAEPNALLNYEQSLEQAERLIETGTVNTVSGETIGLHVDTLCIHGDGASASGLAQNISALITAQ